MGSQKSSRRVRLGWAAFRVVAAASLLIAAPCWGQPLPGKRDGMHVRFNEATKKPETDNRMLLTGCARCTGQRPSYLCARHGCNQHAAVDGALSRRDADAFVTSCYRARMSHISHYRHRLTQEIIQHSVWLFCRFSISLRDVEDLLAERGIDVLNETVRRWGHKFGSACAKRIRLQRTRPSGDWYLDEVCPDWRQGSLPLACNR